MTSERPVLRVYNTLTRQIEPFVPADPHQVTFYTCGPTVYDDAHIGNFRSFLAADVLRRWLESPMCALATAGGGTHEGPRRVVHVLNITDVGHMTEDDVADGGGEDKMALAGRRMAEAKKSGGAHHGTEVDPGDPYQIAAFYAARFVEDARRLGLKVALEAEDDPTLMPRASDNIEGMIAMIAALVDGGSAYVRESAAGRAVYFDVQSYAGYGRLSGNTLDKLKGGAGGRVSASDQLAKKHPADFLLWKEDPGHLMKWDSPWGVGYPGWHIECSVMALRRLADGEERAEEIDVHSGGEDNIFPHHECERAQTCSYTGRKRFARLWFHPRFLMVEGAKMSKSRGTFFTARQLFDKGHEPAAVRLELIKTHYRSNADFSMQGLKDAARTVDRWRAFVKLGQQSAVAGEADASVREAVARAMQDDLNISGAIGAINRWINDTPAPARADAALLEAFDGFLGVLEREQLAQVRFAIGVFLPGVEPSEEVESLLVDRAAARADRDFARADAIRDELAGRGYLIKDVAGGKVEVGPV